MDDNWGNEREKRGGVLLGKDEANQIYTRDRESNNEISRKVSPRLPVLIALRESASRSSKRLPRVHTAGTAKVARSRGRGRWTELCRFGRLRRMPRKKNSISSLRFPSFRRRNINTTFNRCRSSSESKSGTFNTATTMTSSTTTTIHKYAS